MTEQLPLTTLVGFILALVRTTAWMAVSPPFNNQLMPRLVKVGCAAALAMAIAPELPATSLTLDPGPLLGLVLLQAVTGLVLGFLTLMLFSAIQAAGQLIDLFGGFTMSMALDPFGNNQSSTFGRFYQLIATTLLFVTNGYLLLIKGFLTSFKAVPLGGVHTNQFEQIVFNDITTFMLAAVEIAGPLLACYFLTEITLGLLSKAAPQLNVLQFGFPFKILMTLLIVGSALPMIPGAMSTLINHILNDGVHAINPPAATAVVTAVR